MCSNCGKTHRCVGRNCPFVKLNVNNELVCTLTGCCVGTLLCDKFFKSSMSDFKNGCSFYKQQKRDQQIQNCCITERFALKVIQAIPFTQGHSPALTAELVRDILSLWHSFSGIVLNGQIYMHRKDRRCFVVAVCFSLERGLRNNNGAILVYPHGAIFSVAAANKKLANSEFRVGDIRYGVKLLRRVFHDLPDLETAVRLTSLKPISDGKCFTSTNGLNH